MREIFYQTSMWIIVLPLITGIWLIKDLSRKSVIILFLVIVATPPQLSSVFFSKKVSDFLYNVYTPIELLILYFFFEKKIYSRIFKRVLKACLILYCTASLIILLINRSSAVGFINEWVAVNNLFYLFWILLYFIDQYLLPEMKLSLSDPFCWSLLGIFVYAACTCLHFFLYAIIQNTNLSIFQSSFNILLYILFAISFWKDKMHKKQIKPGY